MDFADCNDDDWDRDDNDDDVPMPPTRSGDTHMPDRSSPRPYNTTGLNDDDLYFADHNVYRSYDLGRTHFEDVLGYSFLKDVNSYFHRQGNGDWALETETGMKQLCRNLYYEAPDNSSPENNNNGSGVTLKPFVRRWLMDPRRKEYNNITMDPAEKRPEYLRVWYPYAASELPNIDDPEEVERRAAFFTNHIRMLLHNEEDHVRFMVMWFAFILQRPGLKTQVAILLYGDHGIGKNAPFLWFAQEVLGIRHFYNTANMNDILGEYAVALKGCRLCLFDEISYQESRGAMNKIKNLITNPFLQVNEKHKKQITVKCLTNILFTTNSSNAMPIQPTERRFVVYECSSAKKQDHAYFAELHRNLYDPRTARAVYQYLMAVDLSGVGNDLQAHRPITEYLLTMKNMNMPSIPRFASYLVNYHDTDASIASLRDGETAAQLFERFRKFLEKANPKLSGEFTEAKFFTEFNMLIKKNLPPKTKLNRYRWQINGVRYAKSGGKTIYGFDFDELRKHLVKNDLYVEDGS